MLAKDDDIDDDTTDAETSSSPDDCLSFLLGVQLARFVAVKVRMLTSNF